MPRKNLQQQLVPTECTEILMRCGQTVHCLCGVRISLSMSGQLSVKAPRSRKEGEHYHYYFITLLFIKQNKKDKISKSHTHFIKLGHPKQSG